MNSDEFQKYKVVLEAILLLKKDTRLFTNHKQKR